MTPESATFTQVQDLSAAFARLVETAAPGIVAIQSDHARSSGFFWRPGLVVTADEALSEEGDFAVTLAAGDSIKAQLVGRDPTTDIEIHRAAHGYVTRLSEHERGEIFDAG